MPDINLISQEKFLYHDNIINFKKLDFPATRLLSGETHTDLKFHEEVYCVSLPEDASVPRKVAQTTATHPRGKRVLYQIHREQEEAKTQVYAL